MIFADVANYTCASCHASWLFFVCQHSAIHMQRISLGQLADDVAATLRQLADDVAKLCQLAPLCAIVIYISSLSCLLLPAV